MNVAVIGAGLLEKVARRTLLTRVAGGILRLFGWSVLTLIARELIVRALAIIVDRPPIVASDARAGWAARANLRNTTVVNAGGKFVVGTDRDGHRGCYAAVPSRSARRSGVTPCSGPVPPTLWNACTQPLDLILSGPTADGGARPAAHS